MVWGYPYSLPYTARVTIAGNVDVWMLASQRTSLTVGSQTKQSSYIREDVGFDIAWNTLIRQTPLIRTLNVNSDDKKWQ